MAEAGTPWSQAEIEATVTSYFRMLRAELLGQPYVKAEENRLLQAMTGRTKSAVEMKFQNVSSALITLGAGFVDGYKPLGNAQQALRDEVARRWELEPDIEQLMLARALSPLAPARLDLVWQESKPPEFIVDLNEMRRTRTPVKTDFVRLEAEHRELGRAGEEAVVHLERRRLRERGLERLADKVEHVSVTLGDGLGYDVLSYDDSGAERFIEVKTTRRAREFPFLVTRNEVALSAELPDQFRLYRVFNFDKPRLGLYELPGSLDESCKLSPTEFIARPRLSA